MPVSEKYSCIKSDDITLLNTAVYRMAVLTVSTISHRVQLFWLRAYFFCAVDLLECSRARRWWTTLFEDIIDSAMLQPAGCLGCQRLAVLAIFG